MSDNDVDVKFGASIEALAAGLEEAKGLIEGVTEPIAGVMDAFNGVAEAIAAAFAVDQLKDFAEAMAALGTQTQRAATILGESTDEIGGLKLIAEASGLSLSDLTTSFSHLARNLATDSKTTQAAVAALGLSIADLRDKSATEQLGELSEAFAKLRDGAAKDAIAMDLFGRAGANMLPLLNQGRGAIEQWGDVARETGVALDENLVGAMENVHRELVTMDAAFEGVAVATFAALEGAINGAIQIVTDLTNTIRESIASGGVWADAFKLIGEAIQHTEQFIGETILIVKNLAAAGQTAGLLMSESFQLFGAVVSDTFVALGEMIPKFFSGLVEAGVAAAKGIGEAFAQVADGLGKLLSLDWSGAKAAFAGIGDTASATAGKIGAAFAGVGADFSKVNDDIRLAGEQFGAIVDAGNKQVLANAKVAADEYRKIWGGAVSSGPGGPDDRSNPNKRTPNFPTPASGGRGGKKGGADSEDLAEDKAELDAAKNLAKSKEDLLNEELKAKKITLAEWLQGTEDALNQERESVKATYDKELQTAGLTSAQIISIKRQEADALAAIDHKIVEAETKAAEETQKEWDKAFKEINDAFTGQISGLIQGTTTFKQAMVNVLQSLAEKVTKFFVDWGLKAVENQIKQAASNSGILSSFIELFTGQAAAASAAAPPFVATSKAEIVADAAVAAAGAYASTAAIPIVGPELAPAAAATAKAATLAFGSFDLGAWSLPRDMFAQVHRGEMIVPAAQTPWVQDLVKNAAGGGRGGGGAGEVHNHFHGALMDAASVTRAVVNHLNRNPKARPAY